MRRFWEWLSRDWTLKLAALGVAVLLWSIVKAEEVVTVTVGDVPVRVHLRDPRWQLAAAPLPERASVQLSGPLREMVRLRLARPRIIVPVEDVRDPVMVTVLRTDWVHLGGGFTRSRVEDVQPASVRLLFRPLPGQAPPVTEAPLRDSAGSRPDSMRAAPRDSVARQDSAPRTGAQVGP